jgi:hypothetical protein
MGDNATEGPAMEPVERSRRLAEMSALILEEAETTALQSAVQREAARETLLAIRSAIVEARLRPGVDEHPLPPAA